MNNTSMKAGALAAGLAAFTMATVAHAAVPQRNDVSRYIVRDVVVCGNAAVQHSGAIHHDISRAVGLPVSARRCATTKRCITIYRARWAACERAACERMPVQHSDVMVSVI